MAEKLDGLLSEIGELFRRQERKLREENNRLEEQNDRMQEEIDELKQYNARLVSKTDYGSGQEQQIFDEQPFQGRSNTGPQQVSHGHSSNMEQDRVGLPQEKRKLQPVKSISELIQPNKRQNSLSFSWPEQRVFQHHLPSYASSSGQRQSNQHQPESSIPNNRSSNNAAIQSSSASTSANRRSSSFETRTKFTQHQKDLIEEAAAALKDSRNQTADVIHELANKSGLTYRQARSALYYRDRKRASRTNNPDIEDIEESQDNYLLDDYTN